MKIICIGRNYTEHIAELNNATPDEPVVFLKPDSALMKTGNTFIIPEFSSDIHHEIELVVKICKNGKHIQHKFAHRYFDQVTVGIDFTARDIQQKMKEKGLPWEKAKAFDNSAVIGNFVPVSSIENLADMSFSLNVNDEVRQKGNSQEMIHTLADIIVHVSTYFTLKQGDIIFTGTPKGVAAVRSSDVLTGFLNNQELLRFDVK